MGHEVFCAESGYQLQWEEERRPRNQVPAVPWISLDASPCAPGACAASAAIMKLSRQSYIREAHSITSYQATGVYKRVEFSESLSEGPGA